MGRIVVITALTLGVYPTWGVGQDTADPRQFYPNPFYRAEKGKIGQLVSPDTKVILAARTRADYRDFHKALGVGDRRGLEDMVKRGELIGVPDGTRVLVLDVDYLAGAGLPYFAEVRIEGGQHDGVACFVEQTDVGELARFSLAVGEEGTLDAKRLGRDSRKVPILSDKKAYDEFAKAWAVGNQEVLAKLVKEKRLRYSGPIRVKVNEVCCNRASMEKQSLHARGVNVEMMAGATSLGKVWVLPESVGPRD